MFPSIPDMTLSGAMRYSFPMSSKVKKIMRRADRLFQIVQFLRTRRITTAKWLSEELEVSERTIYRDVQDLSLSGVPIEGEAGVGYVLRKGFDLPPLMFSNEEITALILGMRLVKSWADPGLARAADRVANKVESVLPESLKNRFEQPHLFAPMTLIHPDVALAMGEVRAAIEDKRKMEINYTRKDGQQSNRTIWPLGLFFWGSVWTLGTWCELRESFRIFRLDRMDKYELSDETYPQRPGRTLDDLITLQNRNMDCE